MTMSNLCPKYEAAFQLLGRRWIGLIIKVLFDGPMRFKMISEQIPMISEKVLADRLKLLEKHGIIRRNVYAETPVRIEYELTEKGMALKSVMAEVQSWANQWMDCPVDEQ
ncbi:winged helix-turn-helix transcriptional regulator [Aeribacillus pallidus]|jgi:DNA-binding HxlR family transcriptional regulator|uniref:winged helix-turn-helix transcriptional regulator n=1 Tax=Aeribacillus pallidus TaxID=33936 RepID=UPI003D1BBBE5